MFFLQVPHFQCADRRFPNDGECFGKEFIKGFSLPKPISELVCFRPELFIGKVLALRLQSVDGLNNGGHSLQFPLILTAKNTLYEFPDITVGPIVLAPATLAGDPGVVTAPGVSQWNQVFTKQNEIALFEEEELYWGIQFNFNGTNGQMAKLRPADYVDIRAHATVKASTKIPEDDNGEGGGS